MDDLRTALAIIFKRKGSDHLTARDIINMAAYDYHWFDPENARKFVALAEELRLIRVDKGSYTTNFNYRNIEPTLDFTPGVEMLAKEYPKESIFPRILNESIARYDMSRQDFMRKVNRMKEETGTDIEIASLLVLAEMGKDISEYVPEVKKELMKRYKSKD